MLLSVSVTSLGVTATSGVAPRSTRVMKWWTHLRVRRSILMEAWFPWCRGCGDAPVPTSPPGAPTVGLCVRCRDLLHDTPEEEQAFALLTAWFATWYDRVADHGACTMAGDLVWVRD